MSDERTLAQLAILMADLRGALGEAESRLAASTKKIEQLEESIKVLTTERDAAVERATSMESLLGAIARDESAPSEASEASEAVSNNGLVEQLGSHAG